MSNNNEEPLDVKIKGNIKDLLAFAGLTKTRKKKIKKSVANFIKSDPVNDLSRQLHPKEQHLTIKEVVEQTKTTRTYRLVPDVEKGTNQLAYFRAGQYLSFKFNVNGSYVTRPYSISSCPCEALEGLYEISIRKEEDGFVSNYIWEHWKSGASVLCSDPLGLFYYDSLRDTENVIGIAGGSGITPFRSIAREIAHGNISANLTLFYGCSDENDIPYYKEFKKLEESNPNFKLVVVLSCEEVTLQGCETGFISKEIIEKHANPNISCFFLCGPHLMYDYIDGQLNKLKVPISKIRREVYGEIKKVTNLPGFPQEHAGKTYTIKVHIGNEVKEISGKATESVLVSLERAKLAPPSQCRSGECGYCRSLLLVGNVFVNQISDKRREAEKRQNFFHPCSSYPISNLEIKITRHK